VNEAGKEVEELPTCMISSTTGGRERVWAVREGYLRGAESIRRSFEAAS
jgi:hypothetical protein